MDRMTEILHFLKAAGIPSPRIDPLEQDASSRRYFRIGRTGETASMILMDAPVASAGSSDPFLRVARHLSSAAFSAPEIIAEDRQAGLVLMEDLGDALYARVCADHPEAEAGLYAAAVDALARLASVERPENLLPYSAQEYVRESNLVMEWYLPAATKTPAESGLAREFARIIKDACHRISGDRTCLVLRDYHAENLIWLPERTGIARVGLLDFQDALWGHPAYDLVSLLEDARRDTSPDLRDAMIDRYCRQTGVRGDAFMRAYATLGAQRNLKIIGIFTRLFLRDGKAAYLDLIERVWAHLENDLSHPSLSDLRHFVDTHLPPPSRTVLHSIQEGGRC